MSASHHYFFYWFCVYISWLFYVTFMCIAEVRTSQEVRKSEARTVISGTNKERLRMMMMMIAEVDIQVIRKCKHVIEGDCTYNTRRFVFTGWAGCKTWLAITIGQGFLLSRLHLIPLGNRYTLISGGLHWQCVSAAPKYMHV